MPRRLPGRNIAKRIFGLADTLGDITSKVAGINSVVGSNKRVGDLTQRVGKYTGHVQKVGKIVGPAL